MKYFPVLLLNNYVVIVLICYKTFTKHICFVIHSYTSMFISLFVYLVRECVYYRTQVSM